MKYRDVSCPDALLHVVCQKCKAQKCKAPLVWTTVYDANGRFPMDATAEASCCGRLIYAYTNSIHIYDTPEGE